MGQAIGPLILGSSTGSSGLALTIPGLRAPYGHAPDSVGTGTCSPTPAGSGPGDKANSHAIQFLT